MVTDPLPEPRENDLPQSGRGPVAPHWPTARKSRKTTNNLQESGIRDRLCQEQHDAELWRSSGCTPLPACRGTCTSPAGTEAAARANGISAGGALGAWARASAATYPETAVGMSFGAAIRNRSAQADNIRSQLERNQTRNQRAKHRAIRFNLQVQQSRIGLIQGKAQVEAAREAVRLAQESRDAEQEKLRGGLSTAYNVILKERDLVSAQYAAVQVEGNYANALVAMDQATGTTLERNGVRLDDALSGIVTTPPTPPYQGPAAAPAPRGK